MGVIIDFVTAWFQNIYSLFSLEYPVLGVSVMAVTFGVILIKLTIKLFYYAFGFSSGNVGKLTRGDAGHIVRREDNNDA